MLRVTFIALQLIFLARYPVVLGLLLAGLAPFAVWGQPGLLQNLLVLNRQVQLFNVTWMSLLVSTLVIVAFRIVQINAAACFSLDLPGEQGEPVLPSGRSRCGPVPALAIDQFEVYSRVHSVSLLASSNREKVQKL
jgi:hypothetical protein